MTEAEKWRKACREYAEWMGVTGFTIRNFLGFIEKHGLSLDPPAEKECEHEWRTPMVNHRPVACRKCGKKKE